MTYLVGALPGTGKNAGTDPEKIDGWMLVAANELYTHQRDKTKLPGIEELTIRVMTTQTMAPVFPDFSGGWQNSPATYPAANRTLGLAAAAQLLFDTKRGLITVYLVQHAGFPGDGGQSGAAFKTAAEAQFGG